MNQYGFLTQITSPINHRYEKMISSLNNIRKILAIHSFPTLFKILVNYLSDKLIQSAGSEKSHNLNKDIDTEFDQKWGVDTGGIVRPVNSDIVGNNWLYGQKYEACNPDELKEALDYIRIDHSQFVFVDLGSGKGRALLIASSFPFRKIIGVEYSRQLAKISGANILLYPETEKKCKEIEIICTDAATFKLPEGPLIIFIFNSFGGKVMRKVLVNIIDSYNQQKRQIIILYFNVEFGSVWRKSIIFKETIISKKNSIFETIHP